MMLLLINISSFCNLYFLFYKEENRELGAIFCLLLLLLVYNGVREMLKYALRVPFCIALPLYCVHGQMLIDKSRIRIFWSTAGGAGGGSPQLTNILFK